MSRRAYAAFLVLTIGWIATSALAYDVPYGWLVADAIVWWGLVVMTIATGYYLIQEGPAARTRSWVRRDFAINGALLVVLLFLIMDGATGWRYASLRVAGWTAFAVAAVHPLAVDLPHRGRHADDPAGSPVPQYVPPACVWIDWTLAALLLGALLLLGEA